MKLLRFGIPGQEKPGLFGPDGEIRDLSEELADIEGECLSPDVLDKLKTIDPSSLPCVDGTPRLGAPVGRVPKFIGVGLNYADHAAEAGMEIPEEPVLFTKATSCICGPYDDIVLPGGAQKGDWEVELAFVIGSAAKNVSPKAALEYIAGYCICNDVSERAWQLETTGQWLKGKSADTFGPLGPWLVTRDEIPDPQSLEMFLEINGEMMQTGNTSKMIFTVPELVSVISKYMTLYPGDVVTTGTPPGVGMGRKPQIWLKAGDVIRLGIQGLGEQRQRVVRANAV